MTKYEGILIFKPDTETEKREAVFNRLKGIMEKNGKIEEVNEWGKRKLAYEINYIKEGYYYLVNFESGSESIKELERIARISDDIIRFMFIRKDEK